jgi:hypothetical protein
MHHGRMRIPEEIAATTGGLVRVAIIALLGFAAMAFLLDAQFRPLAFVMGGVFLTLIAVGMIHLRLQSRYGTATLIAERPFELDKPFAGTIETGLREVPGAPVRIRIAARVVRSEATLVRTTVDPMLLRRAADGSLVIPFYVPPPEEPVYPHLREIRLYARTAHWPLGWGATFLIADRP